MIKLLMLCFLLTACVVPMAPEDRGIEVLDTIEIYNQDKAMFTAQYMVEDEYQQDFGDLWLDSIVYWTDTRCPKNGQYAVIYDGKCYHGLMWNCDEIFVALSNEDSERTCGSALLDEYGHCLLMEMDPYHSGCPDHSDDRFWNVINIAKQIACERKW